MTKQISIIGCGWLGLPLAKHLLKDGYRIKGSTTSIEKLEALNAAGIEAFYVETGAEGIKGEIENCLAGSEVLIINMPPGLRRNPEADFVKQIDLFVDYIEKSSVEKVLFISSTSVYAEEDSIPVISEESGPNPTTESGKQLVSVETLLKHNPHFKTTILRFAGLFGEDRDPARYMSGQINLKDPNGPVNLIHLKDCIGIIREIIDQNSWNKTFNAATEPHPSRQEYYTSVCTTLKLPLPQFDTSGFSKGKQINSQKLIQMLGYEFQVKLNN